MKKICLCLLALCLLAPTLLCLTSCATLDTTGLIEAAPALLEEAKLFNDLYYGRGLPYLSNETPVGNYYPADPKYLAEYGFSTVAEMQEKTAAVFSADYCRAIYSSAFSGFSAEGSGYIYARYSSSQPINLRDENETILVSSTAENHLSHILNITYNPANMQISEVGRDYAILDVTTHTTYQKDETHDSIYTETEVLRIRFVYENGWRIDSATY